MQRKGIVFLLCVLACALACGIFASCDNTDANTFFITATESIYYLDEENELHLSGGTNSSNSLTFEIIGENAAEATITANHTFTAKNPGVVTIKGHIGETESKNTLTILCTYTNEKIAEKTESVLDKGIHFGATYDIGLTTETAPYYAIEGADGILRLSADGELEVYGIKGRSDKMRLLNAENETVVEHYFTVENTILCTNIKRTLIEKGKIEKMSSDVPNALLEHIEVLQLSGDLINNPEITYGIKYLQNLQDLDLSNNDIDDLSFIENLTQLRYLRLANNRISNIDSVLGNRNLMHLDLHGNSVVDLKNMRYMDSVEYLDLSDNEITDISPLSTAYSLKSLFISGNHLAEFKDSLSGLEDLTELGVGNCNISFNDILSLKYLPNLTFLDISGTDPTLANIASLTNLKTLILSDCNLFEKDLKALNQLTHLETLDISENRLDAETYNNALRGASLSSLRELRLGGNAFTSIPDMSEFSQLNVLDLSHSYNLVALDSLRGLPIRTLILDECTSLRTDDGGMSLLESIQSLPYLTRLSIVSGFNYVTRDIYSALKNRVLEGSLSLRFLENRWVDATSIENFSKAVYFSLDEFLENGVTQQEDGSYVLKYVDSCEQVVLSLINDNSSNALTQDITLSVPYQIFRLDIYGNPYKTYRMRIRIEDRKESSFTVGLFSFKSVSPSQSAISAASGSKTIIKAMYGACELTGGTSTGADKAAGSAISGHNIDVWVENGASLKLVGGAGYRGANGQSGSQHWEDESKTGKRGGDGAASICGVNIRFLSGGITAIGGRGGNGGDGGDGGSANIFNHGYDGGRGGNGGNGGNAVRYIGKFIDEFSNTLIGGAGGNGGAGGDAYMAGKTKGPGSQGNAGAAISNR